VLPALTNIFAVTGGQDLYDAIAEASELKAAEMNMEFKREGRDFEYFRHVVTADNGNHQVENEDIRREEHAARR
jgi:hypothetical protein